MGGRWKNDNRGVSLVEILVVVAIIAVLGSVGYMAVDAMSGRPAQKCAQQIVYSLEKHRTSTMGKVNAKYVLRVDSSTGKIVADEYLTNNDSFGSMSPTNTYALGDKKIKISYVSGGATKELASAPLTLQFNRESGAFQKQGDGSYCTKIIIERGGRTYEVTLVPLTGKVYID